MARVKRRAKRQRTQVSLEVQARLLEPMHCRTRGKLFGGHVRARKLALLAKPGTETREEWEEIREDMLPEFIAAHPGNRPRAWWTYDAPKDWPERPTHDDFDPLAEYEYLLARDALTKREAAFFEEQKGN